MYDSIDEVDVQRQVRPSFLTPGTYERLLSIFKRIWNRTLAFIYVFSCVSHTQSRMIQACIMTAVIDGVLSCPASHIYNLGPFCRLLSLSLSLNMRRKILPLGLFGITSTNSTPPYASM